MLSNKFNDPSSSLMDGTSRPSTAHDSATIEHSNVTTPPPSSYDVREFVAFYEQMVRVLPARFEPLGAAQLLLRHVKDTLRAAPDDTRDLVILELAVGSGLQLVPVVRWWLDEGPRDRRRLRVYGLDTSAVMLEAARRNLDALIGEFASSVDVVLLEQDMKAFGLHSLRQREQDMKAFGLHSLRQREQDNGDDDVTGIMIDIAMCAAGSIHHLLSRDDLASCIQCVRDVLRPGSGRFLVNLFGADEFDRALPHAGEEVVLGEWRRRPIERRWREDEHGVALVYDRYLLQVAATVTTVTATCDGRESATATLDVTASCQPKRIEEGWTLRATGADELRRLLLDRRRFADVVEYETYSDAMEGRAAYAPEPGAKRVFVASV